MSHVLRCSRRLKKTDVFCSVPEACYSITRTTLITGCKHTAHWLNYSFDSLSVSKIIVHLCCGICCLGDNLHGSFSAVQSNIDLLCFQTNEVTDSAYMGSESTYSECETFTDEDTGTLVHHGAHDELETDSAIDTTINSEFTDTPEDSEHTVPFNGTMK